MDQSKPVHPALFSKAEKDIGKRLLAGALLMGLFTCLSVAILGNFSQVRTNGMVWIFSAIDLTAFAWGSALVLKVFNAPRALIGSLKILAVIALIAVLIAYIVYKAHHPL